MKVFTIFGVSGSGKTTTAELLIAELRRRHYSVGTVKDIHFEGFAIDQEGTNTFRHKAAGSQLVTARGLYETDVLFQRKLSIEEILDFYNHDFVILEGPREAKTPKILTAKTIEELDDRLDDSVFAISGVISEGIEEYQGIPVINAMTEASRLADLVECKVLENEGVVPTDEAGPILGQHRIAIKIGGRDISAVPFVENIIANTIIGIARELKGYSEGAEIEIVIKGDK